MTSTLNAITGRVRSSPFFMVGLIVLAIVLVGFAACQFMPKAPKEPYRFGAVDRGNVTKSVSASGTLQALVTVQVGSQISGQIQDVLVDFNSQVTRGQVLATINPDTYASRVQQSQADLGASTAVLAQQQAALHQAQAQAALDKANYDRTAFLSARGIASAQALDQARATMLRSNAAVEVAQAQIGAQRARVVQSQASVRVSAVDLNRTRILSPIDGVVVSRQIDPGQTVAASLQAPVLFLIAQDLSKLQVKIMVDEADIGQVREGMAVTFTVDAFPNDNFRGVVTQVRKQPETAQNVVAYVVIAEADNPQGRLLPGMTANADILIEQRTNVLRVPVAALRFKPADQRQAPSFGGPGGGMGGGQFRMGGGGGGGGGGGRAAMQERIQRELGLSAAQKTQFEAIQRENFAQIRGAIGNPEAMRKLREDSNKRIMAILTPAQRTKYEALQAEMVAMFAGGRGGASSVGVVYILRDNKPVPVAVRLGASDGTVTEVTPISGQLKPGDQVIVGGGPKPKVQVRAPIPGAGGPPGGGGGQRR